MTDTIITKSVARDVANIVKDFILLEEPMSRLVFQPTIHNGGIKGRLIRQRRESKGDRWKPDEAIDIRKLEKKECINIELPTEAVNKFCDAIVKLVKILETRGIEFGINSYTIVDPDKVIITDDNKLVYIKKLLEKGYAEAIWESITEQDPDLLTKLSYARVQLVRNNSLKWFEYFLNEDNFKNYKINNQINKKDETIWQEFFQENSWIFGYGLDYRFNSILQREFHASDTNADGSDGVIVDYLLADNRFTTFVEIKLPSTRLFGRLKNRAGAWQLSSQLCSAISQLLEQKASGEIKISTKNLYNEDGNLITQSSYNSKVILVIGSWDEIKDDTPQIKELKEKTFELFRRELKNIEIITYDELYNRAKFIVSKDEIN